MKFLPIALVGVLALAGCSASPDTAEDAAVTIVASTNVYGDIASTIGGDLVEVTSIIDDPSQDPHSYEGNARVQLALSTADIVIENGGGYDDWAGTLLAGADNDSAVVLNASDISGYDQEPTEGEFNEHVWYDFPAMEKLATTIADELASIDAANAAAYRENADTFTAGLAELQERAAAGSFAGTGVAITEPVPLYVLDALGLDNVTPEEFSEAIEEGGDVPPSVLLETIGLFAGGEAGVLVYNEQTTGPETEQVLAAAEAAGTPVVGVTETLPEGEDYLSWMSANLDALESALS